MDAVAVLTEGEQIMSRTFFRAVIMIAGATLAVSAGHAPAQNFPSKPIRFLVGFAPGGSTDIMARIVAEQMTLTWGQQVVVDNRGGAAGLIAADFTAKSAPDGYTLLMAISNHVIAPSVYAKIPYDTINDFAPVSPVGASPFLVLANVGLPAKNLQEFIALAKSRPGQLNFATPGVGSIQHLSNELLNTMAGIKLVHVPYKGGVPALMDTIAGAAAVTFITPAQALPQVRAGKVRAYGISSLKRATLLPEVPTVAEAGVPGFEATVWFGVLTQVKTPRPVINKLHAEIARMLALPDVRERMAQLGVDVLGGTPEQLGKMMRDDLQKWSAVAKQAGIKPE
jgi:tripartite-type tricarboxylate transporter receptor subunit TctC